MLRAGSGLSILAIAAVGIVGCGGADGATGPARSGPAGFAGASPEVPRLAPVPEAQAAFYRQAFPDAARFEAKPIPSEMLRSLDQGNDTYVQAYAADGSTLGYLRDFHGKITLDDACECDPLRLTLAFDAEHRVMGILTTTPLTKRNHVPMTDEDVARLVELAKNPPTSLVEERRTEAMVDATTGATQPAFAADVVPQAALTSHRVVGLVRDTQRILQGAPLALDRQRLRAVLEAQRPPAATAAALADLLPSLDSEEVGAEAYRWMVASYVEHLQSGGAPVEAVERRFVEPEVDGAIDPTLAAESCYRLLNQELRRPLAERCAERWSDPQAAPVLLRLHGSLAMLGGRPAEAVPLLRAAAEQAPVAADPWLHHRLGEALRATGDAAGACGVARALFLEHPLFPGGRRLLEACQPDRGDVVPLLDELHAVQKQTLLSQRTYGTPQVPDLPVEDQAMQGHELRLYEEGKVTVVVFFATWCPHCQVEIPRVVSFERALGAQPELGDRVRVVGVRTGVEKETEPFEDFVGRHDIRFPVWTDPVMSLAFSKFVRSQGLMGGIPLVAVIDDAGYAKYFLRSGDFRDTARELVWAVRDVLDHPQRDPVAAPDIVVGEAPQPGS